MPQPVIEVLPDADRVAARAADLIADLSADAVRDRGRFAVALAGGSTPEKAYALLAAPDRAGRVSWDRWLAFLGDERFVPADDPRSNGGMARRSLLAHVPIPPSAVFPVPTDAPTPAAAAAAYAATLATAFAADPSGPPPGFDLILLGLGDDAHTASLFPGKPALGEGRAWVTDSPPGVLPPPVDRVTFTFPTINAARHVVFLVTGEKKAAVVRSILSQPPDVNARPASAVRPTVGQVWWLLDHAAASALSDSTTR